MPDNILFYAVFLSQILLLSFYFPRKMLKRISYVLATYPPSQCQTISYFTPYF